MGNYNYVVFPCFLGSETEQMCISTGNHELAIIQSDFCIFISYELTFSAPSFALQFSVYFRLRVP